MVQGVEGCDSRALVIVDGGEDETVDEIGSWKLMKDLAGAGSRDHGIVFTAKGHR